MVNCCSHLDSKKRKKCDLAEKFSVLWVCLHGTCCISSSSVLGSYKLLSSETAANVNLCVALIEEIHAQQRAYRGGLLQNSCRRQSCLLEEVTDTFVGSVALASPIFNGNLFYGA